MVGALAEHLQEGDSELTGAARCSLTAGSLRIGPCAPHAVRRMNVTAQHIWRRPRQRHMSFSPLTHLNGTLSPRALACHPALNLTKVNMPVRSMGLELSGFEDFAPLLSA